MSTPPIEAAVLVPVVGSPRGTSLVLIVRTDFGPHAGQVAFPGGRREPEDRSLIDTALREFEEELGVPRSCVTVSRTLTPMDTWSSGFGVTPVVGRLERSSPWRPDPREVEDVLEIPVASLRDPANRGEVERVGTVVPCLHVGRHVIWGLTYRIVERLPGRLSSSGNGPSE